MRITKEIEELALEQVRVNNGDLTDLRVTNRASNIAEGCLLTITGRNTDGRDRDVFAFVHNDNAEIYYDLEEFAKALSKISTKNESSIERLVKSVGITGFLALAITAGILYLVVMKDKEPPAVLANALATILGFFFGTKVMEERRDEQIGAG